MNFSTDNYDKNLQPLVNVPKEQIAFGKKSYQQGDMNLAPITQIVPSKSAFKMPKNSVSSGDSSRLQQASRLPGRVSDGNENSVLSS